MRLVIGSRQSDLARIQAYQVGDLLKKNHPHLEIEYLFKTSLGDRNLTDPLWKLPEKGVFTEDFLNDLKDGHCDLVVHSWKDLPTEDRPDTQIAATLPRADMRDMLLIRKDKWQDAVKNKVLKIYSSSPRRAYNLEPFFKEYLPGNLEKIKFESVRGNIPTRIRKLIESEEIHGLIVAKAALDRLLKADRKDFLETQKELLKNLKLLNFCVLPLKTNPAAAAQGALAIEIKKGRSDILSLLKPIHCQSTFDNVEVERKILKSYGGGCHQKIGVSSIHHPHGRILSLKGLTDRGEVLNQFSFHKRQSKNKVDKDKLWPLDMKEVQLFDREYLEVDFTILSSKDLFISKRDAWPLNYQASENQVVWTSGLSTWKKLAQKNIWVHGSCEGLGESFENLEHLLDRKNNWVKLTHNEAEQFTNSDVNTVVTYKLIKSKKTIPNLKDKTHFYWPSGSAFSIVLEAYPEIADLNHACGPGHSFDAISKLLKGKGSLEVHLDHKSWLQSLLGD